MKNTHILYGFLTALAIIIINVILYITNNAFHTWSQYVSYVPLLIGLILNANAFSKANDEGVTFGKLFSSCYKACAIITIVVIAWSFIAVAIFPDMVDKAMEAAKERMMEKGNVSQEQLDQGIAMMQKGFKLLMVIGVIVMYIVFGALLSLVAAAIAKKKPATTMPY